MREVHSFYVRENPTPIEGTVRNCANTTSPRSKESNDWIGSKYFGLISSRLYSGTNPIFEHTYVPVEDRIHQDFTYRFEQGSWSDLKLKSNKNCWIYT